MPIASSNKEILILYRYTNRHAEVTRANHPDKHKMKWHPTTVQELKAFFGLVLAHGVVKTPTLKQHWSIKRLTATPAFRYANMQMHILNDRTIT